jgi:hypothetical protein
MSPVILCENGKYRIGNGKCIYDSKEKAERAYKAYLVQKHDKKNEVNIDDMLEQVRKELDDLYELSSALDGLKRYLNYLETSKAYPEVENLAE